MARILVISPSGEIYNHDCVRWYEYQNIQKFIRHYHNIGDAFVFDSSLKLLRFDKIRDLNIRSPKPGEADLYNAEYDYCFLRGSNWIRPDTNWENAVAVLEKLKIPVIAFGIGAQAPTEGSLILSDQTKRVLQLIAESTASIGVRGNYTAEVLWNLGIKNARVIGCPTAFRRNDPDLRIDLPALKTVRKVGITMRREVSTDYARNIERYLTLHRDLVKMLAASFDVDLMMQGEVEEKMLLWGTEEQKAEAWGKLKGNGWFAKWFFDKEMEKLYQCKLFYSDIVADYETLVRAKDLVIGYRLHGNLMALANGVPSIYFTYDSRTVEFAETFGIPSHDVFSDKRFRLEDYWDQSLFERFNRLYHQRYRDMRLFLDENGVPNKMVSDVVRRGVSAAA